ncbi:MAG TPA: mucoidy inhibitor MuiA family protein [Thermoflexia bacterium]|nr:mucoidy inhibitor MuiA family protein [Thermoflexia bacterium]
MIKLQTTITAVTVYPDRARVTRSGAATLEPGSHRLEILELPLSLDADSVRASARGTASARLFGVDVRRDFYTETPAERVRALEEQVESLEDEMRGIDAQDKLLKQEHSTLGELAGQTEIYARGLAYGKVDAEAQMALFDSVRERVKEINAALLELTISRREMERRLQKMQKELDQVRGAKRRERYAGIVEIEVHQAGELTVELTYVVSGAGWWPLYDIRLSGEERPAMAVGYLAQVTQRSGEDWDNVALTLSTARPALAETLPELAPWYIGPVRAQKKKSAPHMMKAAAPAPAQATAGFTLSAKMDDFTVADAVKEAEAALATVETSGAAVTYRVEGAASVPADGAPHKVTVASFELSPNLDYVTAPKLVEETYRRAKATNDSVYTLLAGTANLFSGDEFIGATELELVAPQGEIELYLGTDDRVTVERELKQRTVDKKLLGDRRRLRYGYEITLKNLLPIEAKITLHDQIPVPRHEDIKVKLESAEPKPVEQNELNLLEWELTLASGEEQVVRFDFTIEHPREMSLLRLP